jgi:hypothetical protein
MYDNDGVCDRIAIYLKIAKGVPNERWLVNMFLTVTDKHVLHYLLPARAANRARACRFKIKLTTL